eukprot:2255295-Alexandrium_andersonii.AAC.1
MQTQTLTQTHTYTRGHRSTTHTMNFAADHGTNRAMVEYALCCSFGLAVCASANLRTTAAEGMTA